MEFLLIIVGFILLIKASDYFVDASTAIAKIFKISEIIIGATIVSIGTTLPEAMVSATSAFKGHGDIAYGNALGSIICNTALISALTLIFSPKSIRRKDLITTTSFFFFSFAIYAFNAYAFKGFSRTIGIVLLSIFVLYSAYIIITNKNNDISKSYDNNNEKNEDDENDKKNIAKHILVLFASAIVIAFASNLLVSNGILVARRLHVSEAVIGITMIALGTSLPELSTAITAIMKGHSDLSIGNIIGANFFNVVFVSGVAIIISPFSIPNSRLINNINSSLIVDIPVALIVMIILCFPTLKREKTERWQGILLIGIYILFIIYQFSV